MPGKCTRKLWRKGAPAQPPDVQYDVRVGAPASIYLVAAQMLLSGSMVASIPSLFSERRTRCPIFRRAFVVVVEGSHGRTLQKVNPSMRLTFALNREALRRAIELTPWAVPGALLALMPKCPMCLAGYVALWTGIGLSLPVATGLRTALITACIAVLLLLIIRRVHRKGKTCHNGKLLSPKEQKESEKCLQPTLH